MTTVWMTGPKQISLKAAFIVGPTSPACSTNSQSIFNWQNTLYKMGLFLPTFDSFHISWMNGVTSIQLAKHTASGSSALLSLNSPPAGTLIKPVKTTSPPQIIHNVSSSCLGNRFVRVSQFFFQRKGSRMR